MRKISLTFDDVFLQPSAHSGFPDPRVVRTCLERMEKLDKHMYLEFNGRKRQLVLKVQTPIVSARTIFGGLDISINRRLKEKLNNKLTVMVKISDMLSIVNFSNASNIDECVVAAVERKALIVYLTFEDEVGAITHYIPLIDPSDVIET